MSLDLVRLIRKGFCGLPEIPMSLESESFFLLLEIINCNFSTYDAWVRLRWPPAEPEYAFWHILVWRMCCPCCVAETPLWQGGTESAPCLCRTRDVSGPRSSSGHQRQTKWPQSCSQRAAAQHGVTLSQLHKQGGNRGEQTAAPLREGVRTLKECLPPTEEHGLGQPLCSSPGERPILRHLGVLLPPGFKISSVSERWSTNSLTWN